MPDFTTLENVKAWLGLKAEQTDNDALLARLIVAASAFFERETDRKLLRQQHVEVRDGNGHSIMLFREYPVTAVASVVVEGLQIPASAVGFTETKLVLVGYAFSRGAANVTITYTAGYETVPADVEQAVIDLVAFRYRERDRIGLASKGMAGETTAFIVREVPPSVARVLNDYRRVVAP
jgi:uncharacterized phiE125 gp8 family phage protein